MGLLEGKAALITGGGAGIGKGIVRRFAKEGAQIVVAEIDTDKGAEIVDEVNSARPGAAKFIKTDVRERLQIEAAVAETINEFGGIDLLINNAFAPTPKVPLEKKGDFQDYIPFNIMKIQHNNI